MLPTPNTSHVAYNRVYEPAEDSFLLLDTLSSPAETAFLAGRFAATVAPGATHTPPPLILEVGPGSGIVVAFLTAHSLPIFGTRAALTLAVDVNRFACAATHTTVARAVADAGETSETGPSAGQFLDAMQGDLVGAVRRGCIDVLVFNPPYVPTEAAPRPLGTADEASRSGGSSDASSYARGERSGGNDTVGTRMSTRPSTTFEEDSRLLELAYAGGRDGMEITDRLLAALPETLSERGCAYVLLCAQNRPEEVKARIRGFGLHWRAETVGNSGRQAGWEKLQIIRIWRDVDEQR